MIEVKRDFLKKASFATVGGCGLLLSHQYLEGILYIVNGRAVIENGAHGSRLPGKILRKKGWSGA